jgi:acyl-CoA thioester hydrolase
MRKHAFRFRVQLYDVNAFAELSPTGILRFLQQAASEASAALGFDVDWYAKRRTAWLIRRTVVDLHAPASYRDEVEVRTWVSDIHRVRSLREYEMHRISDGMLVARGQTDWVYVDMTRLTPTRPPADLQTALMPDGIEPGNRTPRVSPNPPREAFNTERRVEFPALDSVPHVNNARYAAYLEQDLWDALAAHGWDIDPLARQSHLRPTHLDIEYLAPAFYRDCITTRVWVTKSNPRDFACAHVMARNGQPLLHAHSRWQWTEGELPASLRRAAFELTAR